MLSKCMVQMTTIVSHTKTKFFKLPYVLKISKVDSIKTGTGEVTI